jgi:hypothetical protein
MANLTGVHTGNARGVAVAKEFGTARGAAVINKLGGAAKTYVQKLLKL